MANLWPAAKQEIKASGLTLRGYARSIWGADVDGWHGDACGCSDDRCIGYHHDELDDCGCLSVLIKRALDDLAAQDA